MNALDDNAKSDLGFSYWDLVGGDFCGSQGITSFNQH